MDRHDMINKLESAADKLDKVNDELYEKRNSNQMINADDVIYIVSSYLDEFYEELNEVIDVLKGETEE